MVTQDEINFDDAIYVKIPLPAQIYVTPVL